MKYNRLPRVSFDGRVDLLVDDDGVEGRASNLSTGGIFVEEIEPRPDLDSRVGLAFSLPGGAFVEGNAKVVRTIPPGDPAEPPGVALRFERLEGRGKQRIKDFIGDQTRPKEGVPVRIRIGDQVMRVESGPASGNVLQLDCPLPFLELGAPVDLLPGGGEQDDTRGGTLRWVSIHVPPKSTTPRIRLGVELSTADTQGAIEPIVPARKDPTGVEVISSYLENEAVVVAEGPHTRIPKNDRTMLVDTSKQRAIAGRSPSRRWLLVPLALTAAAVGAAAGWWVQQDTKPMPAAKPVIAQSFALPAPAPQSTAARSAVATPEALPPTPPPVSKAKASAKPKVAAKPKATRKARKNARAKASAKRRATKASKRRLLIRAHLRQARRALKRRDFARAHRHADRVMRLDPGNPEAAALLSSAISRQI